MSGQPALCCNSEYNSRLAPIARSLGWQVLCQHEGLTESNRRAVAVVELDSTTDVAGQRLLFPQALMVGANKSADVNLGASIPEQQLAQLLQHGESYWRRSLQISELATEVGVRRERLRQLSDIGVLLSSQVDLDDLLETILCEARRIANCEGGSLYLLDGEDNDVLVFKLAQNDAFDVPYVETRLPVTPSSLAGYVAVSGEELNIDDVYELPEDLPFRFNRSFDEKIGYRTHSMLVVPMRDHRDHVVGVLQFINRMDERTGEPLPFDEEITELLRALASQAAVSIQRNTLVRDINQLFEGFVLASVKTIERRDPTTSGHSFRVAESTLALMESLPKSSNPRFRDLILTPEHLREVRYAALLHDFGKVGVREEVLLKAKKLPGDRLEILRHRFELQKERLRRRAVEKELELFHHSAVDLEVARRRVHRELDNSLSRLDEYWDWVVRANEPNMLDDGEFSHLISVREEPFRALDGTIAGMIDDDDLLALSIRRGSLTPAERREIQTHVVQTKEFLSALPWPPELAGVPDIAGAHHEKLDGSGYPDGLVGEQIPLAARVMAVCDIYDALTAMDRPYKAAMAPSRAVMVLEEEARKGLIDAEIVDVFVTSKLHETLGKVANA